MSQGIAWPFPFAFRLFLALISIEACLTLGPWTSANAQFDIGVGARGGGDRIREDRGSERDRNIGVGVGIGIEVGRAIEQNSTKGNPPEPKKYGRKDGPDKKKKDGDGKVAKPDDKKTDDKKDDKKPPQATTSIDDCLMIIDYPPGFIEAEDGATNTDIKGSAQALKAKLKGTNAAETITKENTIAKALKKFTEGNKCCKRIIILGHGYKDGSLTVPYPTYEGGEGDKPFHVGGSALQQTEGQKAFDRFTNDIKDALCKDPKSGKLAKDSEVRIHACWSADTEHQDHPIAEEMSKKGITTWGHTDVVKYPYTHPEGDDSNREYSPPTEGDFQKIDAVQPKGK